MTDRPLPFLPDWRDAMLRGTKTATTRTARHAEEGDTFRAFGARFEIVRVARVTLGEVAREHYREEGVASPEEFERVWVRLHPRAGFVATKAVYLHEFRCCGGNDEP